MSNLIVVSNFEEITEDNFYLSDEWAENISASCDINIIELRKMAHKGELFEAYIVDAKNYALYHQMDAEEVIIDADGNVLVFCENVVIGNWHKSVWDFD